MNRGQSMPSPRICRSRFDCVIDPTIEFHMLAARPDGTAEVSARDDVTRRSQQHRERQEQLMLHANPHAAFSDLVRPAIDLTVAEPNLIQDPKDRRVLSVTSAACTNEWLGSSRRRPRLAPVRRRAVRNDTRRRLGPISRVQGLRPMTCSSRSRVERPDAARDRERERLRQNRAVPAI
jgi:hypothetical protein